MAATLAGVSGSECDVRLRALSRGAEILGGRSRLRAYLNVSAVLLGFWMNGTLPPPPDVFLKVVDLIETETLRELRGPK